MKELSIEEKAKRYDEAIEIAMKFLNKELFAENSEWAIKHIFPELKESEDEKIRKEIITYLSTVDDKELIPYESWIAWLNSLKDKVQSKQDEHDITEPKFKVGDWVVRKDGKNFHDGKTVQFTKTDEIACQSDSGRRLYEDKIRLWTINDAKNGDVLCYKDEISLYKHDIKNCTKEETTFGGFVYHCCYDGKRFITDSLYSLTEQDKMDIYPATTEQRNILFLKMQEAGYEWDSEKKEPIRRI